MYLSLEDVFSPLRAPIKQGTINIYIILDNYKYKNVLFSDCH